MKKANSLMVLAMSILMLVPTGMFASSHREAPITALDHAADVTDWYAFVSYDHPDRVTMILNVDPLLEPANGPNYFPFDPNVLYEMEVDNNQDGIPDITFQFRFKTEIRLPGVFTGFVGGIYGIPPITSLTGPGSTGLSLRQSYTVTMIKNGVVTDLTKGKTVYAVPSNVGPLTMPDYDSLFNQGVVDLGNNVRVFAGTVDDPFYIDLGAAFDSLNFRMGVGGILSPAVDADDKNNYAPDAVAGLQRQLNRAGSPHHHAHRRWQASRRGRETSCNWNLRSHRASTDHGSPSRRHLSVREYEFRAGQPRGQLAD